METITNYLETLFLTLPRTPQTQQAKADLLAAMEDHYHALIEEGKSEHEAIGAVISEFGSIDELKEELELESSESVNLQQDKESDISRKSVSESAAFDDDFGSNATADAWPKDKTFNGNEQTDHSQDSHHTQSARHHHHHSHRQDRTNLSSGESYTPAGPAIELEEAETFWQLIRRFALKISGGVLIAILGVATVIFFGSRGADFLGLSGMFIFAAIAVGLFITGGMSYSDAAKRLDDRPIAKEVHDAANHHTAQYSKSFRFSLVLGIMTCIFAFVPLFYFGSYGYNEAFGVALFLGIVGLGSFLIIYGSIVYSYYKKFADQVIFISDEDAPGPNARRQRGEEISPVFEAIEKVYWPLVMVFYFWWSFHTGNWAWSWVIFMIAGPVFAAIKSLFRIKE